MATAVWEYGPRYGLGLATVIVVASAVWEYGPRYGLGLATVIAVASAQNNSV